MKQIYLGPMPLDEDDPQKDFTRRVCTSCHEVRSASVARCPACNDPQFRPFMLGEPTQADSMKEPVPMTEPLKRKEEKPMSPTEALEERRKKTTLRKVERKHAGKIVQPYAIMERLINEVEQLEPLKKAKIVIVWKSGWKPTKDDILKHAQIRKLSELEREIWGDQYDLCMLLHRELWQSSRFTEDEREMDIFHEMLHQVPEVDDKTGQQKMDDKGRLVWRLRNHPIQRFPEEIHRYGIEKVLQLDESAMEAVDDDDSQEEAIAEENDAKRPLLQQSKQSEKNGDGKTEAADAWKLHKLAVLKSKLSEKAFDALEATHLHTLGELQEKMNRHGEWWAKELSVHGRHKQAIEDAFNAYIVSQS